MKSRVRVLVSQGSAFVPCSALVALLVSCASPARNAEPMRPRTETAAAAQAVEPTLVALVDGDSIEFASLRASLIEVAGVQVLKDAVLDARLAKRLARERIVVANAAVDAEQSLLLETLSSDATRAVELLGAVRERQGLGEARFRALLRRNAGMRALVARGVVIDDAALANAYDILHGCKRVARVAVLSSLADAEAFVALTGSGRAFTDLAVERSLDESAARGGLLAPLARRDPSYPEALRAAIFTTAIGGVSQPVLDGSRFYVVAVLSEQAADGVSQEAARAACEKTVRLSRERLLMDALARELSSLEGVTVFDRGFDGTVERASGR